ncbi:MAG: thioredoxin domain-containing protein [Patescibacteria group bacterium]|jgi:protein-disulfide isomerase
MLKLKSPLTILSSICVLSVIAAGIVFFSVDPAKRAGADRNSEVEKIYKENNIGVENNKSDKAGGEVKSVNNLPEINADDHLWGDLQNPVKMIIYSDFECPFCSKFAKTVEEVKSAYDGKVVIAFRHRPLAFHSSAMLAALTSECAAEQDKFWQMHDKLFADAGENNLSPEEFKKDAGEIGLSMEKFNQCFDSEKYKDKILDQSKAGEPAGARGTPTFFVNGEIYPGAYPFPDFKGNDGKIREGVKSIIERHLAPSPSP